jgi:DNA polymerase V
MTPESFSSSRHTGFTSPADDFIDRPLDLNEHLIKHPAATFFVKVEGDAMIDAGILPGALLIIDRSLQARSGSIILAVLDGEFILRRLKKEKAGIILFPENPKYKPVTVRAGQDFEVWGVVAHVVRSFV